MVIDTMIFAYALLGVPRFRDEALSVLTNAGDILVPDCFRAELVNVVWQWTHENAIPLSVGLNVLTDADALITQAISADQLWERALELSVEGTDKETFYFILGKPPLFNKFKMFPFMSPLPNIHSKPHLVPFNRW